MASRISKTFPFFFAAILAGCSDSLPEMSDQQILELFADRTFRLSANQPLTIRKNTEECIRLISGMDKEIYKDMPEEVSGQIKTSCRKAINERLSDTELNPMELTLQQVETGSFAERLTKVRANAETAAKQFVEAEQERKKSETIQKHQAIIDKAKNKLAEAKAQLEDRLKSAAKLCSEWKAERELLKQRDRRSPLLNHYSSYICETGFAKTVYRDLAGAEERIAKMKVNPDSLFAPAEPYFGRADIQTIEDEMAKLNKQTEAMKGT